MKTLILGPLDYPSARRDLILFNHNNEVYSICYALEGLIMSQIKSGKKLENEVAIALLLADHMTQKEYDSSDIFFGLAPKKYHFDRVLCYNKELISAQEDEIRDHYKSFDDGFWTTVDITEEYSNIMEAIKHAKPEAAVSDQLPS